MFFEIFDKISTNKNLSFVQSCTCTYNHVHKKQYTSLHSWNTCNKRQWSISEHKFISLLRVSCILWCYFSKWFSPLHSSLILNFSVKANWIIFCIFQMNACCHRTISNRFMNMHRTLIVKIQILYKIFIHVVRHEIYEEHM